MNKFFKVQPWWIYAILLVCVITAVAIEISQDKHFAISSYYGIACFMLIVLIMLVATIIAQRPQFGLRHIIGITVFVAILGSVYAALGPTAFYALLVLVCFVLELCIYGRVDSD